MNVLKVMLVTLTISVTACDTIDFKGMVVSEESANERFEFSERWNSTHPFRKLVVPTDNYRILSMADAHVGGTNNLDAFFCIANNTNVSAVVMVGDMTNGGEKDYDELINHLPDQDSLPSFAIAGNHDINFEGWNFYKERFGTSTYLFTIKTPIATDMCICLESGSATLGNEQINWLRNLLQTTRKDYRHCIVFTHTNFFRSRHVESTNPLVEEITTLLELFDKNNVDMLVTGHDHKKSVDTFGYTTYIVMDGLMDGLVNAGYFQISMQNGDLGYEFMTLE